MALETARPVRQACLLNAERLITAAKEIRNPDRRHISYHLAALALEEIGKASMITISSLPMPPTADGDEEDSKSPVEWVEDHERKLFWALFLPTFHPKLSADKFRQLQKLARDIHQTRLSTLYVDPTQSPEALVEISDEMLDSLLGLTEARLDRERVTDFGQPDEVTQQNMIWFLRAIDDPQLRMIILSQTFVDKLDELGGNYRTWIGWLRERIEEVEKANRELAEKELRRAQPSETEADKPKWQLKIRLRSSSHSIRPKPLGAWNLHVDMIKLYGSPDKRELLVHFTLAKGIPAQALWAGGQHISWLFVIALNIGSFGFFWWYTPTFVSKYYETIEDLENKAQVILERNPPLSVNWKIRALKGPDLTNVSVVFAHLIRAESKTTQGACQHYFRALSLLAKTDVFVQFEANALVEFYESIRGGLAAYGEWDGAPETFESAAEKAFQEMNFESPFVDEVKRMLQLAGEAYTKKAFTVPISLDDAIKMKTFCDAYFLIRARRDIQEMASKVVSPS